MNQSVLFINYEFMVNRLLLFLNNDAFSSCEWFDVTSKGFEPACFLLVLCHFNISGSLWLWLQAYLSYRFQFVSANNCYFSVLYLCSIWAYPRATLVVINNLPKALTNAILLAEFLTTQSILSTWHTKWLYTQSLKLQFTAVLTKCLIKSLIVQTFWNMVRHYNNACKV